MLAFTHLSSLDKFLAGTKLDAKRPNQLLGWISGLDISENDQT